MIETLYTKRSSLKKAGVYAPGPIGTARRGHLRRFPAPTWLAAAERKPHGGMFS